MKTARPLIFLAVAVLLAACGTTGINQMALQAHSEALQSQRLAIDQHASTCATAAAGCAEDMCRVAVMLACGHNRPDGHIPQPQLRSPGEEFARGFSPVASLLSTGVQVWGAGWLVDRSGRNMVDLAGSISQMAGQLQAPVDNSIHVGGNYGDTRGDETHVGGNYGDTRGDEIGRDQIGRDQRVGDDIRDACIGGACRNASPGPIDNSDNSDRSTRPPEPPGDDTGGP